MSVQTHVYSPLLTVIKRCVKLIDQLNLLSSDFVDDDDDVVVAYVLDKDEN